MKPALFHEEAEAELHGAIAYYEGKRRGLGADFQAEVEKAVQQVQKSPGMFPLHREDVRKSLVRRFPFTVFFQDLDEAIWVLAVAHQKRKPDYWIDRLE